MKFTPEVFDTIIASLEYALERAKGNGDSKAMQEIEEALQAVEAIGTY